MSDSLRSHGLAHQAPLSVGFSRQEYWSGLPCPPPGNIHWVITKTRDKQDNFVQDNLLCLSKTTLLDKAREFQKNLYFWFIDYAKSFDCVDHYKLRKILKEMGIPDHLTYLLRNLYACQVSFQCMTKFTTKKKKKQQLELGMEQQTGSKLGKEYVKAVYCQPAYLTYMQSAS